MTYIEHIICKKFRRIFKNAGYKTFIQLFNLEHLNYTIILIYSYNIFQKEKVKNQRIKVKNGNM